MFRAVLDKTFERLLLLRDDIIAFAKSHLYILLCVRVYIRIYIYTQKVFAS